ncbi:MAG: alpha/beta hydrolase fold domain-containing protein [Acidobacteria bacterium]|nr:alpha/beta hydrolase fold domain-containing protein [Acidobacteriota bacterium]
MKFVITLGLLALCCIAASAQSAQCLPVKARNLEGNYMIPGTRGDIVYRRIVGISGRELALDAYVQKRGAARPAVIIIHGGGGDTGSRIAFIGQFLELLTAAGYNWFAVDYRLTNADEAVDDVHAALVFIRCHAQEFRIDTNRIALLGEDTGAQLALRLAQDKSLAVQAVVSVGGRFAQLAEALATDALLIHGAADREVPLATAESLCQTVRRCQVLPVEGAIHRAENWRPAQWSYKTKLLAWLNERMKLRAADHEPSVTSLRKKIVFDSPHGLTLDAYVPKGRGPHPAVMIVHGGGWEAGDRVTYATPVFAPLARAGFAWFSIDYRLTPQVRHAEQLEDVRTAFRFVHDHARRFNIDPLRLALLGESASGQMVAQLATESLEGVAAVVSFYGVYDFATRTGDLSPNSIPARLFGITQLDDEARATLRRYSPLHNAKRNMPPLLLICGTKDGLYDNHTSFVQRLEQLGARHTSVIVESAPHGIENWEGHSAWLSYKDKLVEWLRATLGRKK